MRNTILISKRTRWLAGLLCSGVMVQFAPALAGADVKKMRQIEADISLRCKLSVESRYPAIKPVDVDNFCMCSRELPKYVIYHAAQNRQPYVALQDQLLNEDFLTVLASHQATPGTYHFYESYKKCRSKILGD